MKSTVKHLAIAIFINIVIVVFEAAFGILIGSLALITDALHNLFDVASMALSILGEKKEKGSRIYSSSGIRGTRS